MGAEKPQFEIGESLYLNDSLTQASNSVYRVLVIGYIVRPNGVWYSVVPHVHPHSEPVEVREGALDRYPNSRSIEGDKHRARWMREIPRPDVRKRRG